MSEPSEPKKEEEIINDLLEKLYSTDCDKSFIRKVNSYNFETGYHDVLNWSDSDVFAYSKQAVIRFAQYLSRR